MPLYDDHLLYDEHIPYNGYVAADIVDDGYIPDYKVIIVDKDGKSLFDLSAATINHVEWVLNDVGSMEYFLPNGSDRVQKPLLLENEAQVWVNNSLEWWGFHGGAQSTAKGSTFSCEDLLGYLAGRIVKTSRDYSLVEQRQIAWLLIDYAQNGGRYFGDLKILQATLDPPGVTMQRDRHYPRDEHQVILDLVRAFSGLVNGFDFEIKVYPDGRREFRTYYPEKGTFLPNHALEWGRNIADYTVTEEAWPGTFANRAYYTGPTDPEGGEDKLVGTHWDTTSAEKYGDFEIAKSDGGQDSTVEWLEEQAEDYVQAYKDPVIIPDVTAVEVPVKLLGVVKTGDTIPVRIKNGRVNINTVKRITKIRWEPRNLALKLVFN